MVAHRGILVLSSEKGEKAMGRKTSIYLKNDTEAALQSIAKDCGLNGISAAVSFVTANQARLESRCATLEAEVVVLAQVLATAPRPILVCCQDTPWMDRYRSWLQAALAASAPQPEAQEESSGRDD